MAKIRKPNAVTSTEADNWLRGHLCYEVQMMRELYRQLDKGAYNQFDRNLHIESYHLHARNLIEFFKNKDPCDVDPRRFTKPGYEPDGNFIDKDLEAKINQQISQLTAKRTDRGDQLRPKQWREISEAIEGEIFRFEKSLTKEGEDLTLGLVEMDFSPRFLVPAQVSSATNHIIIIK
jgi:hypothetical protein